jgi:hypothetical protein
MRKIIALVVVVGAVAAQLALAHAATEVARFPANNRFANAVSTAPDGTTTGVFVSREIGQPGGPIDRVAVIISRPDGAFTFLAGVLPQGAFQYAARSASLDVDLHAITLDPSSIGEIPANGVISIDWDATDVQHTAGNTVFNFGNVHVVIAGTRTDVVADVTGTVFGAPLVAPSGNMSSVTQSVIIVTRD